VYAGPLAIKVDHYSARSRDITIFSTTHTTKLILFIALCFVCIIRTMPTAL
jgi:hypothetical protein